MYYIKKTLGLVSNDEREKREERAGESQPPDHEPPTNHYGHLLKSIVTSLSLGMDVFRSGVSLPVQLHEPMTILQRATEMMTYSNLLNEASNVQGLERMAYVVAYSISGFANTERLYSDFNPILGETFEWIDTNTGAKVFAEQVSHHPPISAVHAESNKFIMRLNAHVEAKFLGNSIDLRPQGRTIIEFKDTRERFLFKSPNMRIRNIIFGRMWVEHYGKMIIKNLKTGDSCSIKFNKGRLFRGIRYDVSGYIKDSSGNKKVLISGDWNSNVSAKWEHPIKKHPKGYEKEIWVVDNDALLGGRYNFTKYAKSLTEFNSTHPYELIASTDSRLRIDRYFLEIGDQSKAGEYKKFLEERQRKDRREREKRKDTWVPIYFRKETMNEEEDMYLYVGDYWERRKEKEELLKRGKLQKDPLLDKRVEGLACDFRSIRKELEIVNKHAESD